MTSKKSSSTLETHSNHAASAQAQEVQDKSDSAAKSARRTYHLQDLSEDILLGIWKRLDSPASLVKVSHDFQDMGRDSYFQSQWILWKYGKWEAVYQAIKYSGIFSAELLKKDEVSLRCKRLSLLPALPANLTSLLSSSLSEVLDRWRCNLSRTLVQGLAFAQVKNRVKRGRSGRIAGPIWGRHVETAAFGAVLQLGAELFNDISFIAGQDDFSIFCNWITASSWETDIPTYEDVSSIFEEGRFLPLPIALPDKKSVLNADATQALLVKALVKEPRLIPLAARNGAVFSSGNSQVLLRSGFSKEIGVQGVVDLVKQIVDLPGVEIKRSLATQILMSICIKVNNVSYQSLKQLRFDPILSHLDLDRIASRVITAIHLNMKKIASILNLSNTTLKNTCKTLEEDFSIDAKSVRQATINGLFCYLEGTSAQSQQDNQSQVSDLKKMEMTKEELYQALIQNPIQTARGLKHAELDSLLDQAFFSRLFETLLLLPFKGQLVQAIFAWYDQEIALGETVDAQADRKSPSLRSESLSSEVDELEDQGLIPTIASKLDCSLQANSLHELLSQEIMKYEVKLEELPSSINTSSHYGFLESSTQASLLSFDYSNPTFDFSKEKISSSFGCQPRPTKGFLTFSKLSISNEDQDTEDEKTGGGEVQLGSRDLVPLQNIVRRDVSGYAAMNNPQHVYILDYSVNSVLGEIPYDTSSNGASILNLMGDSKSVSIMFDHALLDDNSKLCNLFLEAGLPAPTLHQFKILAHLNSWIPQWMGPAIMKGAPFVKEYGVTEDDSELLSFQIPIFPRRGSNAVKSKKVKTEVASTVDADTSVDTSIHTSTDTSNTSNTFDVAGEDTTMTSIENESERKVDTSATSLRRSTREKHTRFEAVKENDSESELSDEDEGQGEGQDQDDASSDDEDEEVDGNQGEEAEVKMEGIEEGEEAMGEDRSFVILEDGKPVKVSEKEFNSRTDNFEKWIAHLEGLQRKQEYNIALQKHQLPLTPAGRPSQRKIPKSTFHTQLDALIVDIKSAHKKLLREGNLNLDMESDLSTRDLKAAKLVQELRNEMLELSNEIKEHPNGAEASGGKRRKAAAKSGLERGNLTRGRRFGHQFGTFRWIEEPRVRVNNEKYEDSDDETWDVAAHARRRLLRLPAPSGSSTQAGKKRKRRASSETSDSEDEQEPSMTVQKEVWYCSDSSHSSSESEISADEQQSGKVESVEGESEEEEEDDDDDDDDSDSGSDDEGSV